MNEKPFHELTLNEIISAECEKRGVTHLQLAEILDMRPSDVKELMTQPPDKTYAKFTGAQVEVLIKFLFPTGT